MKRLLSTLLFSGALFAHGYGMMKESSRLQMNTRVLMQAIQAGNNEEIEHLLGPDSDGVEINLQDIYKGNTVLICAVMYGNAKAVADIIEFGANINLQNKLGNTALIEAARRGDAAMVTMLLDACADAEIVNNQGQTVLDVARAQCHEDVVALLEHLVTDRNEIREIAAEQWQALPLEVLDTEIMSFLE